MPDTSLVLNLARNLDDLRQHPDGPALGGLADTLAQLLGPEHTASAMLLANARPADDVVPLLAAVCRGELFPARDHARATLAQWAAGRVDRLERAAALSDHYSGPLEGACDAE